MSLNALCNEYKKLCAERAELEERLSVVRGKIFSEVGDGGELSTEDFRKVKCQIVERSIFDRSKFDELFGEQFFQRVSKSAFAPMIYLAPRRGNYETKI